jgi:hypothetical protein
MGFSEIIQQLITDTSRLVSAAGRIARFSYTQAAYDNKLIEGVTTYDFEAEQNIPLGTSTGTDLNPTILDKGIRAQGASWPRDAENHFRGRVSFNLNMMLDLFKTFVENFQVWTSHNGLEYDPTATYLPTDMVFTLNAHGSKTVFEWFKRTPNSPQGITNIDPDTDDGTHWVRVREITSLAFPIVNSADADLNNYKMTGSYTLDTRQTPGQVFVLNTPTVPDEDSGSFTLSVICDLDEDYIITQTLMFRDTGTEYTRTLTFVNGVVEVAKTWYKSKSPIGLDIQGVPHLWTFRIESDGHLRLYYNMADPPPVRILRADDPYATIYPELIGNLVWDYGTQNLDGSITMPDGTTIWPPHGSIGNNSVLNNPESFPDVNPQLEEEQAI